MKFLRSNFYLLLLAVIILSSSLYILFSNDEKKNLWKSEISVLKAVGTVSIKYPKELWWRSIESNDSVPDSSIIKTSRESLARLLFQSGEELLLGPMAFVRISSGSGSDLKIKVFTGQLSFIKRSNPTKKRERPIVLEVAKSDDPETQEMLSLRKETVSEVILNAAKPNDVVEDVATPKVEVFEDLTEQKEKELELVKLEEELVQAEVVAKNTEIQAIQDSTSPVEEIKIIKELPPMKQISLPDQYEFEAE